MTELTYEEKKDFEQQFKQTMGCVRRQISETPVCVMLYTMKMSGAMKSEFNQVRKHCRNKNLDVLIHVSKNGGKLRDVIMELDAGRHEADIIIALVWEDYERFKSLLHVKCSGMKDLMICVDDRLRRTIEHHLHKNGIKTPEAVEKFFRKYQIVSFPQVLNGHLIDIAKAIRYGRFYKMKGGSHAAN